MAIVSDIEIRLRADIAQLRNDMRRAQAEVSGSVDKIRKSLLTLAAGFGLAEIVNQIIKAQREFDKLNASLITATGSTKAAGEAMKALQSFSAKTPFSLQEVTEGFLKLRNLGLTPSERALESYGNTSAAMGKSLTQLVEAVADAATGEFERLKEFGIKSKQQGDMVAFTFQGTTTKVKNNADEIEEYLTKIGEVNFAGGMKLQADTLDGAISALGDTWSQTLVAFSQSGFGDAVRSGVMALGESLQDLTAIFKAFTVDATEEGNKVDELNGVHFILTTTFEALTVVGLNLAFAFRAVGNNIGAVAAAIANPTQALSILQNRFSDLGQEWDKVNADSEKVLKAAGNARAERAKQESQEQGDRLARYKIVSDAEKTLTDEQIKAAKKAAEEAKKLAEKQSEAYKALLVTLEDRVSATARELAGLLPLNEAEKAHIDLTREIASGKLKLTAAQKMRAESLIDEARANEVLAKSNKEFDDLQQQLIKNNVELSAERYKLIESAKDEAEQNELAIKTFGMTEAAIIRLTASRLMDQEAQRLGRQLTKEEIADLNRVIALKERSAVAVASRAELEKVKTFWTDIEKTAHDTFVSIADGGKNAFQRLKETAKNTFFDWLYQQTIKKWIINIGTSTSGVDLSSLTGGSSGGASSGISMDKIFTAFKSGGSLEKSIAESVQKGFEKAGLSGGEGAPGQAAQWAGKLGSTIGGYLAGSALNKGISGGYETGSGFMKAEKLATAVGSYINPVLGAAIGAISGVVNRAFGMKAKEFGPTTLNGSLGNGAFSGSLDTAWTQKGGWFRSNKAGTDKAAVDAMTASGLASAYEVIKGASTAFAEVLGINADSIAKRTQSISIAMGKDEAANQKAIVDFFAGVANTVATELLPDISKFQVAGEDAATTLQRLATNYDALDQILMIMGSTSQKAFGAVGLASVEARERLIAFAGGLEALASQTTFFNQNFLSQAEQIAIVQKPLNEALANLGYAGITTADQFKAAVLGLSESGALATAEGAKTYAGLLALAPAFKTVSDYLKDVSDAAAQTAMDLADAAKAERERADAAAQAALEANESILRGLVDSALSGLQRSVQAQKDIVTDAYNDAMAQLETRIGSVGDSIKRITDLSTLLKSSLGTVTSDAQQAGSRAAARAQVTTALAIAKASGVLPSADDLRDALATLNNDSGDQFSSLADYQIEVARTNAELQALGGLTDTQLTVAEMQLKALQDQKSLAQASYEAEIMRLDLMLEKAQEQVDIAYGIKNDTLSLLGALATLSVAIQGLKQGATPSNPTGGNLSLNDLYKTVLGRDADAAGYEFWQKAYGDIIDSTEYADFIKAAQPELEAQDRLRRQAEAASMASSGTMSSSSASGNSQEMAQMKTDMARTADAVTDLTTMFRNVSAGGNALLTEPA